MNTAMVMTLASSREAALAKYEAAREMGLAAFRKDANARLANVRHEHTAAERIYERVSAEVQAGVGGTSPHFAMVDGFLIGVHNKLLNEWSRADDRVAEAETSLENAEAAADLAVLDRASLKREWLDSCDQMHAADGAAEEAERHYRQHPREATREAMDEARHAAALAGQRQRHAQFAWFGLLERERDARFVETEEPEKICRSCDTPTIGFRDFCSVDCEREAAGHPGPVDFGGFHPCAWCGRWFRDGAGQVDSEGDPIEYCSAACLATQPVDLDDFISIDWTTFAIISVSPPRTPAGRRRWLREQAKRQTANRGARVNVSPMDASNAHGITIEAAPLALSPASLEDRVLAHIRQLGNASKRDLLTLGRWADVLKALDGLEGEGLVIRQGRGVRGDPHRFSIAQEPTTTTKTAKKKRGARR